VGSCAHAHGIAGGGARAWCCMLVVRRWFVVYSDLTRASNSIERCVVRKQEHSRICLCLSFCLCLCRCAGTLERVPCCQVDPLYRPTYHPRRSHKFRRTCGRRGRGRCNSGGGCRSERWRRMGAEVDRSFAVLRHAHTTHTHTHTHNTHTHTHTHTHTPTHTHTHACMHMHMHSTFETYFAA
jgi:hypothetical protein